jgi:hypothetical protein
MYVCNAYLFRYSLNPILLANWTISNLILKMIYFMQKYAQNVWIWRLGLGVEMEKKYLALT